MSVRKEVEQILRDLKYGAVSVEETIQALKEYIPALRKGTMIPNSDWGWCCCCGAVQVDTSQGEDTCASCLREI